MEQTLLLIKPDGVQRGLIGRIITRIEQKGFQLGALRLLRLTKEMAEKLYEPHKGKGFYEPTVRYMTSSPIVAMVIRGAGVIDQIRTLMGATNPQNAAPGSIRGDFGQRIDMNIVHGSDSPESAAREIPIFFTSDEIADYKLLISDWT